MSFYTTIFAGSVPAGGLLMGALASAGGVAVSIFVGAVLTLVVGIGGWIWLRRIRAADRPPRKGMLAAADIGAIDPGGRSAGSISGARPR
jgi:predicted permease